MMKPFLASATVALMLATPAFADGKIYVALPDLSGVTGQAAETMLSELVLANVISSNCAEFSVTDEEWSLLTDSADILAHEQLKLSTDAYDSTYYDPAFSALDQADACATEGPKVQPMLEQLVALGGSRTALPDQEAAYQAMQTRQARWDALEAAPAPSGKTKQK